jgi:hypothetical protein
MIIELTKIESGRVIGSVLINPEAAAFTETTETIGKVLVFSHGATVRVQESMAEIKAKIRKPTFS